MINEAILKEMLNKSFEKWFKLRLVKPWVFQLFLPYYHEDGDMIDLFIQTFWDNIVLTDFWKTMMRLSYYTDLDSPTKKKLLDNIISSYYVKYEEWKLVIVVDSIENIFAYVMELITVIIKISDISYLKQERVKSMFYEYFDNFMIKDLSIKLNAKVEKDYVPPFDQKKEYITPYAILKKNKPPLLFFPVLNDDRCKDSIMTLLYYKTNNFPNKSIVVFNDFSEVNTKNSWKLIDIADRPLSSFDSNKEKILEYTSELL